VHLEGEEHHHLSHVAQLHPDDKVWLFDEEGNTYTALIEKISKTSSSLSIISQQTKRDSGTRLILSQAAIKSKKMDILLQKATELGMTDFIPVQSTRSLIKINDRFESKKARWNKIIIAALKQCRRSIRPIIHPPMTLSTLAQDRQNRLKLFLSENKGKRLIDILHLMSQEKKDKPDSILIACGPEGGWTEKEEHYIVMNDFTCASLGIYSLRSETAAISCLAARQQFWDL